MDSLHIYGISVIEWFQNRYSNYSEEMLMMTKFGDPRFAFTIYFPLCHMISHSDGIKVLWVAVLSEWLNAVLKWILHGERPYWWVTETMVYGDNRPILQQYRYTCELGPGSPSGHAMVTSAVLYIMMHACLKSFKNTHSIVKLSAWLIFIVFMAAVSLSRCFIATHFPHQVLAGTIAGVLLGRICEEVQWQTLNREHYIVSSAFLITGGILIHSSVKLIGLDPEWSMTLGQKHCERKEWIHLDTTLFHAVVRDASSLLGFGLGLFVPSKMNINDTNLWTLMQRVIAIILSLTITMCTDFIKLPHDSDMLYYMCVFVKYVILMYVVTRVVPNMMSLLRHWIMTGKDKLK